MSDIAICCISSETIGTLLGEEECHANPAYGLPDPGVIPGCRPRSALGTPPSFAFVAEPQTHGVAERFNRTLKEQAIHGRIFRNVEEVRKAVTEFRDRDNRHWRLEKLGFMSPLEARQAHALKRVA